MIILYTLRSSSPEAGEFLLPVTRKFLLSVAFQITYRLPAIEPLTNIIKEAKFTRFLQDSRLSTPKSCKKRLF